MNPPAKRTARVPSKTPAQIAAEALLRANEAHAISAENNKLLTDLHDAWMKPHAVYGNKSLLQCVSEIVADAGAGRIVGEKLVWWAKILSALGVIGTAFYAAVHLGAPK